MRSNIFLGTFGDYLAELGDEQNGNILTSVLAILLPSAVLAIPLISCCITRYGALKTLHIVNALGTLSYIPMLSKNLWVQFITCVLYPLYRGFLYAALCTFVAQAFGEMVRVRPYPLAADQECAQQSVGRVFGTICLMSAVVQPVQFPLVIHALPSFRRAD